ncbi:MAG: hypothetical protein H0V97_03560 [Actinobacteria bacterium]|nr:hypothetical protein [Actinomycetota bacterium]
MISRALNILKRQVGVAMVTVLFAGAVLTVVSSTAAYLTIKEFRSGQEDRKATEALAYAESGLDRLMLAVRTYGWNRINEAGCQFEPISVPTGNLGGGRFYDAYMTVFDPSLPTAGRLPPLGSWKKPGDAWSSTQTSQVCVNHQGALPQTPLFFALTSTGQHPTATRVIRQVVKIGARGLPIGLYADSVNVQGGTPTTLDISLVTPGSVSGREKLTFTGNDPYYKMGHFWAGQSMSVPAPAAVHALGAISCTKQACGDDLVEHPDVLECKANGSGGQSQWDQSGGGGDLTGAASCPGQAANPPPYSSFSMADLERARPTPKLTDQDYANLKSLAQASGLYCAMDASGSGSCTTPTGSFNTNGTIQSVTGTGKTFVAYFEFPATGDPFSTQRTLTWKAAVGPCSDDPAVNESVVIVVRYGSVDLTGQDEIVGSFFAPEGQAWLRGSGGTVKIHGTTIAKKIDFGGNAEVKLSSCWVNNMPGALLRVTPQTWSEVDR